MRKFWWFVWIEVAVVALVLFMGYKYVTGMVDELVAPYLIEEDQVGERSDNLIKQIVEKVEEKLEIRIDYENMIFDYANKYADTMMEQSQEERKFMEETYSIVEEYEDATPTTQEED